MVSHQLNPWSAHSIIRDWWFRRITQSSEVVPEGCGSGIYPSAELCGVSLSPREGVAQDYLKAEMWFALSGPGTDQRTPTLGRSTSASNA